VFNFLGHKKDTNQNYTDFISSQLEYSCSKAKSQRNVDEDAANQEPLHTVSGNAN
jgi:hypothetical protein